MGLDVDVTREFTGMDLGHPQRTARGVKIAAALSRFVGRSLSQAIEDGGQLTLAYRWLRNEFVSSEDLLAPHAAETVRRAAASEHPLVAIHDGTEMSFGGSVRREGLGHLANGGQGFLAHITLLAALGEKCVEPLGVPVVSPLFRAEPKPKRSGRAIAQEPGPESLVWMKNVSAVEELLGRRGSVVHVMDRGGDSFRRLHELQTLACRYVVRAKYDRNVIEEDREIQLLSQSMERAQEVLLTRTIVLSSRHPGELDKSKRALKGAKFARTPGVKKAHPPRKEREAHLHVVAQTVSFLRPKSESRALPTEVTVNVVRVFEPSPPEGLTPVEWLLLTSEPVATADQVARVVDIYRARWLIEEFNKALKTGGCDYESLQLETRESFLNMLSLMVPMAWALLRMRALSRSVPDAPASRVFSQDELTVLAALRQKPFSSSPTVREATLALAAYGGHLKRNGEPGYLILGRALRDLRLAVDGYRAALASLTPVQS